MTQQDLDRWGIMAMGSPYQLYKGAEPGSVVAIKGGSLMGVNDPQSLANYGIDYNSLPSIKDVNSYSYRLGFGNVNLGSDLAEVQKWTKSQADVAAYNAANPPVNNPATGLTIPIGSPAAALQAFAAQNPTATPEQQMAAMKTWTEGTEGKAYLASNPQVTPQFQTTPNPIQATTPGGGAGGLNASLTGGGTNANAVVSGANQTVQEYEKLFTPPTTTLSTQAETAKKEWEQAAMGTTGRGAMQIAEEQARGISGINTEVAQINSKIKTATAEYDQMKADYDKAMLLIENKPITLASISGQQAMLTRLRAADLNRKAADIGVLQADLLGHQGELKAAQDAANRAVDLKYQDAESILNVKAKQLDLIYGLLDKEQARYADAVNAMLADRRQALADQKDAEKQENATKLSLIAKYGVGSTSDTLEQINAKVRQTAQYQNETRPEAPGIFGSAEGGYYQQVYNPSTGKYDIVKVAAGTGGTGTLGSNGVPVKYQQDFAEDMASIAGMKDRDTAIKTIENGKTAFVSLYNQAGYDQLRAEVDRIFPPPAPPAPSQPAKSAYEQGKAASEVLPYVGSSMWETLTAPLTLAGKAGTAAGQFFKGLFGE